MKNPLGQRASALGLDPEELSGRTGLTSRTIYNILTDHPSGTSLSVHAALRLSRPLRVNFFTLLAGHALWRKSEGRQLSENETGWIRASEHATHCDSNVLSTFDLKLLDMALEEKPPPPPDILLKEGKK